MANPSYTKSGLTMYGRILYSGQLATTSATDVYKPATGETAKVATATLCNVSGSAVTVTVGLLKVGDTADGTHRVLSAYSLPAGATLSLKDELGGVMLAEGESVNVQASASAAIDVVLTGAVSS